MIFHTVYRRVRPILPRPVADGIRRVFTAVLAPLSFSQQTGHWRSSLAAKAVNRDGAPLPWYTYPAIDFLSEKDFSQLSVLEFGGGQSTRWWATRAKRVTTFESDTSWAAQIRSSASSNSEIHGSDVAFSGALATIGTRKFDISVVDGGDRAAASRIALQCTRPGGIIILDNSEGDWPDADGKPSIEILNEAGLSRIDFYGMAPGVIRPHCTSMYFWSDSALIHASGRPRRFVT